MNLAQIQTQLSLWIEGLCEDAQIQSGRPVVPIMVEWGRMPRKIRTGPYVLAYLGPIVGIGHDEPRYDYNDLTEELEEHMTGVRRMTLRLAFNSDDQRLGYSARQYAEDFRILTQSTTGKDTLHSFINLGLWGTGDLIEADWASSGRMESQVNMDVTLGVRAELMNPGYDGGYIKNVNIEGQSPVVDEACDPVYDELGNPVVAEETITINVVTE